MSEFIDLENMMEDLIVKCFKNEGEYFRETILNKGGESFSFYTKLKFVYELVISAGKKDAAIKTNLDAVGFTISGFDTNIISKRNILAHAYPTYDIVSGAISLISPKVNVNFDSDWFLKTREGIHLYKRKIREITSLNLQEIVNPPIIQMPV